MCTHTMYISEPSLIGLHSVIFHEKVECLYGHEKYVLAITKKNTKIFFCLHITIFVFVNEIRFKVFAIIRPLNAPS